MPFVKSENNIEILPRTSDSEILECSQAVYNFLIIDELDLINVVGSYNKLPHYKEMLDILKKYHMGDMISFTHYLNDKYRILEKPLWTGNAKSFFSNAKSHNFYKRVIRNLKLKLILPE
jgi:hypothetical protein